MSVHENTLELFTPKNIIIETLLIAAALILPAALHLVPGLNVFVLLPMHWTIFLAGLLYGWRGGLIAGAVAPAASLLFTGMPLIALLPLMTVELVIYGSLTGFLHEKTGINSFVILLLSSIAGRGGFLLTALILGRVDNLTQFAVRAFLPGALAAAAIILALPFAAEGLKKILKDTDQ